MAQILGIDTSNYTTSAALLDLETGEVHQEKQLLPVKVGEVGLRQSDAVFHHTRQLPELLERLRPFLENNPVCGVSVSTRPRNVDGSYMPCFLTGMGTARAVAAVSGVPLYETSHQVGHVLAALYSAGKLGEREKPFLAFHVSGGTTDSLYCEPDADMALKITPCGTSLDLKAGQAIDRVGLMLGLQFPCGKALEQLGGKEPENIPDQTSGAWHGLLSVRAGKPVPETPGTGRTAGGCGKVLPADCGGNCDRHDKGGTGALWQAAGAVCRRRHV